MKVRRTKGGQEEGERKEKLKEGKRKRVREGKEEPEGSHCTFIHSFNNWHLFGTKHGVGGKPQTRVRTPGLLPSLCHAHPVWPWVSPFPSLCLICKRKWSLKSLLALILWGLQVSG